MQYVINKKCILTFNIVTYGIPVLLHVELFLLISSVISITRCFCYLYDFVISFSVMYYNHLLFYMYMYILIMIIRFIIIYSCYY